MYLLKLLMHGILFATTGSWFSGQLAVCEQSGTATIPCRIKFRSLCVLDLLLFIKSLIISISSHNFPLLPCMNSRNWTLSVSCPVLWNKLPANLRSIKSVHTLRNRLNHFYYHRLAVNNLHTLCVCVFFVFYFLCFHLKLLQVCMFLDFCLKHIEFK